MPRNNLFVIGSASSAFAAIALAASVGGVHVRAAKVKIPMTVAARADANPDSTGQPSSVVVRVYQLKSDGVFSRSEFFPLFDDDQKALGADFVSRQEFVLSPAENRNLDITLDDDAQFVGAIAAFRDIRNTQWRVTARTPLRGLTIIVERARLLAIPD
jgi:type VI secretion system protein VasD